jgi:hypothetical protein
MSLLNVNPEAEVSVGFTPVRPGTYRMRIKEVTDRNPAKNDLKLVLEHVSPISELLGIDGEVLKGNPGSCFDYVMLDFEKQWKLRQVVEAAGLPWANLDTMDLQGKELDVIIKLEEYNGEQRNKVARYVVPKS